MILEKMYRWILGIIIVLFLFHTFCLSKYTVDDAYISFRYAENAAKGHGFVFNPGEKVEGYTDFLWVVLLMGLHWLGANTVLAAKILGTVCGIIILIFVTRFVRIYLDMAVGWALVVPLFLAMNRPFASWAVFGLETLLVTLFLVLGTGFLITGWRTGNGFKLSGIFYSLACMTRPDAALIVVVAGIFFIIQGIPANKKIFSRNLIHWCLIFIVIYGIYFTWRSTYYGDLLPNTFYLKFSPENKIPAGLVYLKDWIRSMGYIPLFFVIIGLLKRSYRFEKCVLLCMVICHLGYVVNAGGDWMRPFRFIVPVLPFTGILVICGLETAAEWISGLFKPSSPPVKWAIILITAIILFLPSPRIHNIKYSDSWTMEHEDQIAFSGRWLKNNSNPEDLLACTNLGRIPYYSELPTLDLGGLADVYIAHLRYSGKMSRVEKDRAELKYLISKKPEFIVEIFPIPVAGFKPKVKRPGTKNPPVQKRYRMIMDELAKNYDYFGEPFPHFQRK